MMQILDNLWSYPIHTIENYCSYPFFSPNLTKFDSVEIDGTYKFSAVIASNQNNVTLECDQSFHSFMEPTSSLFFAIIVIWSCLLAALNWNRSLLLRSNKSANPEHYKERLYLYYKNGIVAILIGCAYMYDPYGKYGRIPLYKIHVWVNHFIVLWIVLDQIRSGSQMWIYMIANEGIFTGKTLLNIKRILKLIVIFYGILAFLIRTVAIFSDLNLYESCMVYAILFSIVTMTSIVTIPTIIGVYMVSRILLSTNITSNNGFSTDAGSNTFKGKMKFAKPIIIRVTILVSILTISIAKCVSIFVSRFSPTSAARSNNYVNEIQRVTDHSTTHIITLANTYFFDLVYLASITGFLYAFWFIRISELDHFSLKERPKKTRPKLIKSRISPTRPSTTSTAALAIEKYDPFKTTTTSRNSDTSKNYTSTPDLTANNHRSNRILPTLAED